MSSTQPDTDLTELEDAIVAFLRVNGGTTLRGRFFDVSSESGKRVYAEWLAKELYAIDTFIEHEYAEEPNRG